MRTTDQNSIFHCWCREVAVHLREANIKNASEATVKELVLRNLGNTVDLLGIKIAMRSSKYKRADEDLTPEDHKRGFISMSSLLTSMQAWSSTDLNLILTSPNEEPA